MPTFHTGKSLYKQLVKKYQLKFLQFFFIYFFFVYNMRYSVPPQQELSKYHQVLA